MKWVKYLYNTPANTGTEEAPEWADQLHEKALPYSDTALQIAEEEAYNGEYTIEDDGRDEPVIPMTEDVSWDELAAAIREGVNEA